jgi:hypothetical protein
MKLKFRMEMLTMNVSILSNRCSVNEETLLILVCLAISYYEVVILLNFSELFPDLKLPVARNLSFI